MKNNLIVLTGPTSVGKTELSIKLAKAVNGEIISADSMQVYRRMNIGSAKIKPEEMEGVPHHLIDIMEPTEAFDIVTFKKLAEEKIQEIYSRGKVPIIVGGTGFYIQSVLYDIDFDGDIVPKDPDEDFGGNKSYREYLENLLATEGEAYLYDMLKACDEKSLEKIHMHNHKRVIRALDFFHETGTPISEHNEKERQKESPYNFIYFVLNCPRSVLYERINSRVDIMISEGLLDEVASLLKEGCKREMVSMQGLGYKEIIDYYQGVLTLEEAIDKIKQQTRRFAKRQLTWFRREKEVIFVNKEEFDYDNEMILAHMLEIIRRNHV